MQSTRFAIVALMVLLAVPAMVSATGPPGSDNPVVSTEMNEYTLDGILILGGGAAIFDAIEVGHSLSFTESVSSTGTEYVNNAPADVGRGHEVPLLFPSRTTHTKNVRLERRNL